VNSGGVKVHEDKLEGTYRRRRSVLLPEETALTAKVREGLMWYKNLAANATHNVQVFLGYVVFVLLQWYDYISYYCIRSLKGYRNFFINWSSRLQPQTFRHKDDDAKMMKLKSDVAGVITAWP